MDSKTLWKILGLGAALVLIAGLIWLMLFIVQTAFGYFGYEFTYWQTFVITLASSILFKGNYQSSN